MANSADHNAPHVGPDSANDLPGDEAGQFDVPAETLEVGVQVAQANDGSGSGDEPTVLDLTNLNLTELMNYVVATDSAGETVLDLTNLNLTQLMNYELSTDDVPARQFDPPDGSVAVVENTDPQTGPTILT